MKRKDDPVDLWELTEYYLQSRLAGEPPTIATVVAHAASEGVRADCLCVLLFGFDPDFVFPRQVRRNDHELISCIKLAASAGGFSPERYEVY